MSARLLYGGAWPPASRASRSSKCSLRGHRGPDQVARDRTRECPGHDQHRSAESRSRPSPFAIASASPPSRCAFSSREPSQCSTAQVLVDARFRRPRRQRTPRVPPPARRARARPFLDPPLQAKRPRASIISLGCPGGVTPGQQRLSCRRQLLRAPTRPPSKRARAAANNSFGRSSSSSRESPSALVVVVNRGLVRVERGCPLTGLAECEGRRLRRADGRLEPGGARGLERA